MLLHVLSLVSIPAYLCGVSCLAVLLCRLDSGRFLWGTDSFEDIPLSASDHVTLLTGTGCVLMSFLFLPTGSLPAYIEGSATVVFWLILFGIACATLFSALYSKDTHAAWAVLMTPLLLAVVFVACARYAFLRGFPGSLWTMESYVTMPLVSGAEPAQLIGFFFLATATLLQCASSLPLREDAFFLSVCLRLASAQFFFSLFSPVLFSRYISMPAFTAAVADYVLYWGFVALLVVLVFPVAARFFVLCRLSSLLTLALALAGAALCLL